MSPLLPVLWRSRKFLICDILEACNGTYLSITLCFFKARVTSFAFLLITCVLVALKIAFAFGRNGAVSSTVPFTTPTIPFCAILPISARLCTFACRFFHIKKVSVVESDDAVILKVVICFGIFQAGNNEK